MKAESSQAGCRAFLANVVYLFIALPCLFTKLIFTCQRERARETRHTEISQESGNYPVSIPKLISQKQFPATTPVSNSRVPILHSFGAAPACLENARARPGSFLIT